MSLGLSAHAISVIRIACECHDEGEERRGEEPELLPRYCLRRVQCAYSILLIHVLPIGVGTIHWHIMQSSRRTFGVDLGGGGGGFHGR